MPTRLNQDQVDGLPSDLDSLESFISTEDSAGDSADVSQDGAIDAVQSQVDFLKSALGGMVYGEPFIYQMGETFYFGGGTAQYPVPTTISYQWYYATQPVDENWSELNGSTSSTLSPVGDFTNPEWKYYLQVTFQSDLGTFVKTSNRIGYVAP